ncbi:hypothetical protein IFM89_035727 [Coptis chinensis]|uniref:F-box domain-containing protein n=1 Tax=Coptis chinensis TaxID=261450 RepID=A0A835H4H8_9MAGN|nr:hypothetical protein IFM89_035727 [Coptis chinensis]
MTTIIRDANASQDSGMENLFEGQNDGNGEDRFSNLPEHIILHILSFLHTKHVVLTSVFSSRWRYLWTLVPNLGFCDVHLFHQNIWRNPEYENKFMNFVDRVLFLIDVPYISKFYLLLTKCYDEYRVNSWITTAVMRKAKELVIVAAVGYVVVPRCLFTSESLTTLKIEMEHDLRMPSLINLPSLKVLHLGHVCIYVDGDFQVSFRFPNLEELYLKECNWMEIDKANITAPALERLIIEDDPICKNDGLHNCEIHIFAKSLISFKMKSNLSYQYYPHILSSLGDASVDVLHNLSSHSEEIDHRLRNLLKVICNVRDLALSNHTIVVSFTESFVFLALFRGDLLSHLHKFFNSFHLTVIVEFNDGKRIGWTIRHLIELLRHLPNIESLLLINTDGGCAFEKHFLIIETIPSIARLKSIEIQNFHGSRHELNFLRILLKNARILEKLTISIVSSLSANPLVQVDISRKLRMLSRGSPGKVEVIVANRKDEFLSEEERKWGQNTGQSWYKLEHT